MNKLIIEALVVAVIVVIIGCVVSHLLGKNCDKHLILVLFLTGIITHLLCEYTGVNKWYCKKGHACLR